MRPIINWKTKKTILQTVGGLAAPGRACSVYVFLACAGIGFTAHAEETVLPSVTDVEVVVLPASKPHLDLREILSSELEQDMLQDRRRLSREERDALHRDLRAVLRNVNADYGVDDRAQR